MRTTREEWERLDLRDLVSRERVTAANAVVRLLFGLRAWLGGLFGWDRERSLVPPGAPDGPFRVLFVSPREAISEIQNATVHAFSVFVLIERTPGYRLYWAIYVRPVGRITAWYMRLIDPVRRLVVYPTVLRHLRAAWARTLPEATS